MKLSFSIVIPSAGEIHPLLRSVESVLSVKYPQAHFELIVVDNSSGGIESDTLKSLRSSKKISVIRESKKGPSFARNSGLKRAKFRHVIFIDDDCVVEKNFLQSYEDAWKKFPKATIIGGQVKAEVEGRALTPKEKKYIQNDGWCFAQTNLGDRAKSIDLGESLFSANISVDKHSIDKLFNVTLGRMISEGKTLFGGEDYELCTRYLFNGKVVVYYPKVKVVNIVKTNRFSERYIFWRYFLTGMENCHLDQELRKRFVNYRSMYLTQLGRSLDGLRFLRFKDFFRDYLNLKNWVMLLSYTLTRIGLLRTEML